MNIIERLINLKVDNGQANASLDKTESSLNKVDKSTTKVTQSTKTMTKETTSNTQALLDNGGVMSLLNEITGGLAMTFKDSAEAIGLAGVSLNSFKGIMVATGIGAFVVALGYVVSNFEAITGAIDGSAEALQRYNNAQKISENQSQTINQITSDTISKLELQREQMIKDGATKQALADQDEKIFQARKDEVDALIIIEENRQKVIDKRIDSDKELIELRKEAAYALNTYNKAVKFSLDMENSSLATKLAAGDYKGYEERARIRKEEAELARDTYELDNQNIKDQTANSKKLSDLRIQRNSLEGDKLRKENEATASAKAKADAEELKKIEAKRRANELLLKEEEARLKTLNKILETIKLQVEVFKDDVRISDSEKVAKGLNGQYVELMRIVEAQTKLQEQLVEAEKLRDEATGTKYEAAQENVVKDIKNQIKLYEGLAAQKKASILVSPENDPTLDARLEAVRLNGLAELEMIKGFTFDSLRIKQDAMNIEARLREGSIQKQIDENKRLKDDNQLLFDNKKITEETYIAIKNDLTKKGFEYTNALALEQINNDNNNNSIMLDMYLEYTSQRRALDDEYYINLRVVSENLQGFLGQLQDENLIKSRDIRNTILVAEKGLAIAGIVFDTMKSNQELKTKIAESLTAGSSALATGALTTDPRAFLSAKLHFATAASAKAGIASNTVNAGIGIASILATTISSWNRPSGGGAGGVAAGGGAGPQAQFNVVGASGNNQLAATIASQQNQPVRAYVVGTDVTNQQALDRARLQTATFL
jgi:hypothetical protein